MTTLLDVAARWETFYGEIGTDGRDRWMTQLDHGHEEYEVRMELIAAIRAALEEPTPGPQYTEDDPDWSAMVSPISEDGGHDDR
jgi:hypothetical protein